MKDGNNNILYNITSGSLRTLTDIIKYHAGVSNEMLVFLGDFFFCTMKPELDRGHLGAHDVKFLKKPTQSSIDRLSLDSESNAQK